MKPASKILVVGPSWVGDMVMAQSLFISLKNNSPDCQIDVLAPAWTFSLLDRMPEVHQAIAMPLSHGQLGLWERIQLGRQLRSEHYTQAILLPNSWKSALSPYFANIPKRTGYIGECRWGLLNDARKLDKKRLPMTVQRFVALGLPADAPLPPAYPIPALAIAAQQQQAVIDKFQLTRSLKTLALCPGAEYGPAKRWPVEYFAELAKAKLDQGWQVWIFGSEKDQAIAGQINTAVGGFCADFTGKTSLAEAVDLMSLVHVVVSNDSGLMHLAAALDKQVIALYGSSDPTFTPPLNNKAQIISLGLDCSPCFKRDCPLGHTRCLTGIAPEQVLQHITITSAGRL
ncbi:MAG: lipopolysaccharide heptosyltransferase II [Methylococcales bacterium]